MVSTMAVLDSLKLVIMLSIMALIPSRVVSGLVLTDAWDATFIAPLDSSGWLCIGGIVPGVTEVFFLVKAFVGSGGGATC